MIFWACFSSKGTGQLIAIRGIMKSEDNIKISDENLQIPAQNIHQGHLYTSQQDNDPKLTSTSVTAWF